MKEDELKKILSDHKKWLSRHCGERAGLQRADLRGADLQRAGLRGADLRDADLRDADLQRAGLQRADLQRADLRDADLRGAYLRGADLRGADLRGADLQGADLQDGVRIKSKKHAYYIGYDYYCLFFGSIIKIGCEAHYRTAWEKFNDVDIIAMDGKRALKFWRKEKNIILKISKNLTKK